MSELYDLNSFIANSFSRISSRSIERLLKLADVGFVFDATKRRG